MYQVVLEGFLDKIKKSYSEKKNREDNKERKVVNVILIFMKLENQYGIGSYFQSKEGIC